MVEVAMQPTPSYLQQAVDHHKSTSLQKVAHKQKMTKDQECRKLSHLQEQIHLPFCTVYSVEGTDAKTGVDYSSDRYVAPSSWKAPPWHIIKIEQIEELI